MTCQSTCASHDCPSSVLRWFKRLFMKRLLLFDIVISVVSARTCVRATMWFVLMVDLDLRCSVVLLFMSPRISHRRGCTINGCQAGTRALLNFQMDHPMLLSLFLAHFLISLCLLPSACRKPCCSLVFRFVVSLYGLRDSSPRRCVQWLSTRACFDRLVLAQKFGHMRAPAFACRILSAWQGFCCHFSNRGTMVTAPSI